MSLILEAVSYDPAPEGTHPARLTWAIDIGTQETMYGDRPQVILGFELVEEPIDGADKNFTMTKFFTRTLAKNSSPRAAITSLTGKEPRSINLGDLLGTACLVTVVHAARGEDLYANIQGITAVPKGMKVPEG